MPRGYVSFAHTDHISVGEKCFFYVDNDDDDDNVQNCTPPLTHQVCKQFTEAGFMADADLDSSCLLNKKIRNAQLAQYNFILGE